MAKHIARTSPRCREYFCVTISCPSPTSRELSISAWCAVSGYALKGWRVIDKRKLQPDARFGRMRKVFKQ